MLNSPPVPPAEHLLQKYQETMKVCEGTAFAVEEKNELNR